MVPIRFFNFPEFKPVLPAVDASAIPIKLVGIKKSLIPLKKIDERKPIRSIIVPPPTATSKSCLLQFFFYQIFCILFKNF